MGGGLHGGHCLVRLVLGHSDQGLNSLGGLGRALGQAFYVLGNDGKAPSGFAGHGCLEGSVEGQDARPLGNAADQLHDLADLLGAFAQALDALGCLLHLVTNAVHLLDGVLHGFGSLLGVGRSLLTHRG